MGLFCVNMHFRLTDEKRLATAMNRRGISRCTVLSANNGWTSLYEEKASRQDEAQFKELAAELTKDLQTAAIVFLVHDSDIACYWLYEYGQLLDHFNSCPDYFDDEQEDEPSGASGGRPEVLIRFARPGTTEDRLRDILARERTFAEDLIVELAQALGIDRGRALRDYRDASGGAASDDDDSDDGDDDDDHPPPGRPGLSALRSGMLGNLTKLLSGGRAAGVGDTEVQALVEAAAGDDVDEIARLLDAGAAIDGEANIALPGHDQLAGLGKVFPGGAPKFPLTPLLAAVLYKHPRAVATLLDRGADPNHSQVILGTPVHAAVGAGEVELLRMLLDRGGDFNGRNVRGQTPLQVLEAGRSTADRLVQAQAMMKTMGMRMPGIAEQLANRKLPTEGWDACEKLLRERGAV